MDALAAVRQRFAALEPVIDERTRRLLVAAESSALKNLATAGVVRFVDNLQIINGLPRS